MKTYLIGLIYDEYIGESLDEEEPSEEWKSKEEADFDTDSESNFIDNYTTLLVYADSFDEACEKICKQSDFFQKFKNPRQFQNLTVE